MQMLCRHAATLLYDHAAQYTCMYLYVPVNTSSYQSLPHMIQSAASSLAAMSFDCHKVNKKNSKVCSILHLTFAPHL